MHSRQRMSRQGKYWTTSELPMALQFEQSKVKFSGGEGSASRLVLPPPRVDTEDGEWGASSERLSIEPERRTVENWVSCSEGGE